MATNSDVKVTYYPTQFGKDWYIGFVLSIQKGGPEFTVIPEAKFKTKQEAMDAIQKAVEAYERATA